MNAPSVPKRFPKIHAPFSRHENAGGEYVVFDEWNLDRNWFKNQTVAVEKLDGTNCAVFIEDGRVRDSFTRMGDRSMNYVDPYPIDTNHQRIVAAVRNSIDSGYFDSLHDGYHYGEVVGPKIQGNPYELDELLFVPFRWAYDNLRYKSWGEYGQSFDDLSDWFQDGLFSLFYAHAHGTDLDTASVSNGTFCEGIMFTDEQIPYAYDWHDTGFPDSDNFAKLRRDMFDWYSGERH